MTVARLYIMLAKEGQDVALHAALRNLAAAVRRIPGLQDVELLRDTKNQHRFIFIEKWDSVEAHKAAGEHAKDLPMAPLMAALDGPPDGSYLDYLSVS